MGLRMKTYEISVSRIATKTLRKLPKLVSVRIFQKIQLLATDPRPAGCKKLVGLPHYRIRIGDYRVIYGIDDGALIILIVEVGHRRDVYR